MEQIFGYVDGIVYSGDDSAFVVAKIKEPKKGETTTIVGPLVGVHVGESIRCKGSWKHHPKFGAQFVVESFETETPTDALGIQRYLESGMIKGIGPSYAEKIVQKFGRETLNVIDEAPQKLLSIPGLGEKKLQTIIRCWKEQREVRNVMIFLRGHGVTPSFAQKIFKAYGEESIEKLRENPYRIAQDIRGIGFKSADQIAQNLGMDKEAPQRVESGIQHVLWELSSDGHVCYPKEQLLAVCKEMLEVGEESVLRALHALLDEKLLVEEGGDVWVKPLYLAELGIAREVKRLSTSPCALRGVDTEKALQWVEDKLRIQLAEQQKRGVAEAVNQKLLILTGGPGTGKSTITKAILRISEKLTKKILLAAPTGRAAKRMTEITRRKAFTIHALLEMDFTVGKFKKGRDNPLSADLLIVDEASMIDTQLMYHLLKAVPDTTRVVFVGDIDQLPSVGPGNVLRDLIDSDGLPVVRLTEIFRQARGSDIITNAHKINQGEFPFLAGKRDFFFYEENEPEGIERTLVRLIQKEMEVFPEVQILCPMKRGVIGTENLNRVMQNLLNPSNEPIYRMGRRFHKGDKVMQTRNHYKKEVFNGDVGRITDVDFSEEKILVTFDGKEVEYEFSELDELLLAYAVSIHKYQGSEAASVMIPIHTSHFKLLHRNLLYTGVTRGKRRVTLVGSKKAVAIAVRTEEVKMRHTGLTRQLRALFSGVSRSLAPTL